MEQTEFSRHRVLLVGGKTHNLQLLRSVLTLIGVGKIAHAECEAALDLLASEHFHAVFCEQDTDTQIRFVLAARRRDAVLNPTIPIFLLQGLVRRRHVERARDSGAHDVITVPISPRTVATKLRAATKTPRTFIVAKEFFGPDRRSAMRPTFFGDERRKRAPKKTRYDLIQV
jgi:PleD family two-component response regulator